MDKKVLASLVSVLISILVNFLTIVTSNAPGGVIVISAGTLGIALLHAIVVSLTQYEQNNTTK